MTGSASEQKPSGNPVLIGQAEEIDLFPGPVQKMIDNEGVYLCGDSRAPEATVPIASINGRLYSLAMDSELDPEKFLSSLTVSGPFHKGAGQ